MTTRKKLYFQRLSLAILGLALSIATVEVVLRLYVSVLNEQKTYTFNKEIVYSIGREQKEHASGYLRNDTQEEYSSSSQAFGTIYSLGDSFTNGGNLDFTSSYPYQLHHTLEQKWTIHNMGVCESSSIDTQRAISELLKEDVEEGSIFLILTGATDIFSGHDKSRLTMATPLINIQKKKKISSTSYPKFLNHFKSFLLVKELIEQYQWVYKSQRLRSDLKIVQKLNEISNSQEYLQCLNDHSSGFCLAERVDHNLALDSRDYMLDYLLNLDLGMDSKEYAMRVRSLLDYLKVHGDVLEEFSWVDISATLSFLVSKQSQFAAQDIFSELNSIFNSFPHKEDHLFKQAFTNITTALYNREKLLIEREQRLHQIVSDLKKRKMTAILMTYPLSYSEVNQSIRKVAKESNTHLIDLELIFQEMKRDSSEKLLVDYQHLTKKGNRIVAMAIRDYILEHKLYDKRVNQ